MSLHNNGVDFRFANIMKFKQAAKLAQTYFTILLPDKNAFKKHTAYKCAVCFFLYARHEHCLTGASPE